MILAEDLIENSLTALQKERGRREKLEQLARQIAAGEEVKDRVYIGYGSYKRTKRLRQQFKALRNV